MPVVADRTMYFNNRSGAHASNGLPFDAAPAK
jgi:hypothetical protein